MAPCKRREMLLGNSRRTIGRVLERLPRAKEELFRRRPSTHWLPTNQPGEPPVQPLKWHFLTPANLEHHSSVAYKPELCWLLKFLLVNFSSMSASAAAEATTKTEQNRVKTEVTAGANNNNSIKAEEDKAPPASSEAHAAYYARNLLLVHK